MYYPIYIQNKTPGNPLVISLPGLRRPISVSSISEVPERVQAVCSRRKRKMPVPPKNLKDFASTRGLEGGWWFWTLLDVDE